MRTIVILVPAREGGIGRLFFENLDAMNSASDRFRYAIFQTHGSPLSSLFLFPIRLVALALKAAFSDVALCHINIASKGSTFRKLCFSFICRMTKTKYLLHLHGGGYREFFEDLSPAKQAIVRNMFQHASGVIVMGSVWKIFVKNRLGVKEENISIMPNGVAGPTAVNYSLKGSPPHIVFLGHLLPRKGVSDLLTAVAKPKLRKLDWHLTLAGSGKTGEYLDWIETQGLKDRVSLPGWLPHDPVKDLLRRSSILVLPSYVENFPLSIIEGMANGLCPIATPVGAIPEIITDGVNGLIVPVNNPDELSAALERLILDDAFRLRLCNQARADYENKYSLGMYTKAQADIHVRVSTGIQN